MPNRDENGAKNAERSGDFHPKIEDKWQGQGSRRKSHIGRNSRETQNTEQTENSRFSQGRKSSRLKSLGRKRPDSTHNGRQLPTVQGVSALSHYQKSVGRFYAYGGGWGVVNIKNALFSKGKQGVTIGVKTKNDKRRWAYGVLEKLEY